MPNTLDFLPSIEADLLYATSTTDGTIIFCDTAWKSVIGKESDCWSRLSEEDQPLAQQYIREAGSGSLVTQQLFMVDTPQRDQPLPVLLNFFPVHAPASDQPTQAVTITGEVLAEPASWKTDQTQRHRFESLGRMTMGIVHDFNNLLSGVLGYTELLKTGLKEGSNPPTLEHLDTIEKAASDGAALISKIQQYIRQDKQTRFEMVELRTLLDDCISLTRPYWYNEPRRQGIDIDIERDFGEIPPIMGAPAELREVFVNMILNAVQALPEGGRIVFRTEHRAGQGIIVTMEDTGTGMTENTLERLFEPLYTTKGDEGTGMGLAVSYGIIQEHDGTIDVRSTLGEGTTFTLTFPPADESMPDALHEPEEMPSRTADILVVDDERMVRSVLTKLLSLNGHSVEEVASGAEALKSIERHDFDLIFTDHGMPKMSGRKLAQALRTRRPGVPIILLTGDTDVGEASQFVNEVVEKPFQIDHLERLIQDFLREPVPSDATQ